MLLERKNRENIISDQFFLIYDPMQINGFIFSLFLQTLNRKQNYHDPHPQNTESCHLPIGHFPVGEEQLPFIALHRDCAPAVERQMLKLQFEHHGRHRKARSCAERPGTEPQNNL